MEFVLIPAGSFLPENSGDDSDVKLPAGEIIIGSPFYLGVYPVTQEQWEAVMGNNPAYFTCRNNPVESISLEDIQKFIQCLNAKENHDRYRLPTEAEWEFAARGGTNTRYFLGATDDSLGDYAWFEKNSGSTTHPVGQKKPNPYASMIYTAMSGNWCRIGMGISRDQVFLSGIADLRQTQTAWIAAAVGVPGLKGAAPAIGAAVANIGSLTWAFGWPFPCNYQ